MVSTWYFARLLTILVAFLVTSSRAVNNRGKASLSLTNENDLRLSNLGLHAAPEETDDKGDKSGGGDDSSGDGGDTTSAPDGEEEEEETEEAGGKEEKTSMPSEVYHKYMEECTSLDNTPDEPADDGEDDKNSTAPAVDMKEVEKQKKQAMSQVKSTACKAQADVALKAMSKSFYESHGEKVVKGKSLTVPLAYSRSATLNGWTNVRKFNKGFVKFDAGEATAVVRRLKPGQEYTYAIYQYDNTAPSSKAVETTVSVNGGAPVVTSPDTDEKPTAAGKIKADGSGDITFKFARRAAAACTVKGLTACSRLLPDVQTFDGKQYCCPVSGSRFTTLEYPSVTCPSGTVPIADADACKEIATSAGREYRGVLNNDANWIPGCFEWVAHRGDRMGSSTYVYFNKRDSSAKAKIGGHRLCRLSDYKVISATVRFCADAAISSHRTSSIEDCRSKCDADSRCRYISFWRSGPATSVFPSSLRSSANWCRLTRSCLKQVGRPSNGITIEQQLNLQHELILSGISIATSCDAKARFKQISEADFTYDPFKADLAEFGDSRTPPDKETVERYHRRYGLGHSPLNGESFRFGAKKKKSDEDSDVKEEVSSTEGESSPDSSAIDDKEDDKTKVEKEDEEDDDVGGNTTVAPVFGFIEGEDRVRTPDLSKRSYDLDEDATNNTAAKTLMTSLVEGGDAEKAIPDLKKLDAEGAQDTIGEILKTSHYIDVQTKLVHNHWLRKTCKVIKEQDTLLSQEKKQLKEIKQLSKVCKDSIKTLKKQNVTLNHPIPKLLGQGSAGFETVNPSESYREYSYYSHTSSMLDSGTYHTRYTMYSNLRGESVVVKLGGTKIVRGFVTQGHSHTSNYAYTYNIQWQDENNAWHTVADKKVKDTHQWHTGYYSKRCVDTPNWRSRRYGWINGRYQRYTCSWFESNHYCVRRSAPSRGYLRYWWLQWYYGYPQNYCCACGKRPEYRTCKDYVSNGWCKNGHITFHRNGNHVRNYFNSGHNYPMRNCAACGKGALSFTGGQRNNKVTQLLATQVRAKAIRIIVRTGYPVFRFGVIVGKSEVAIQLSGTPWVGSVNFNFPHHPYKIMTSNDGRSWKTVASGINTAAFYFNPTLHTSWVKLDYQDENCEQYGARALTDDQVKALGFKLVRRNGADKGAHMHPAKDRLVGSAAYGAPCTGAGSSTCSRDFSTAFNQQAFDEFLFTTGDLKHWVQAKKSQVLGWYTNAARTVLCSSDSKSPHTIRWTRRSDNYDDPWISLKDHYSGETVTATSANRRSSECARGGARWYTYDDKDGHESGAGKKRYLTRGDSSNSHTQSYLDSQQGWSSCEKNRGHWLQLDLGSVRKVKGLVTQPRHDKREWVNTYKVRYSSTTEGPKAWQWAKPRTGKGVFEGAGWDGGRRDIKTKAYFDKAISARYLRIYPVRWNGDGHAGLRADAILASGKSPIYLYGENKVAHLDKTKASREHKGLNVYIRMAPKPSKTPSKIPVKVEGYTADPGKLIFPDSKVRIDACGDAAKKRDSKEAAVDALGKLSESVLKQRKDIAESVEFINDIKSIRSRIETFRAEYTVALNDTLDWSKTLLKAHLPLTTIASAAEANVTEAPEEKEDESESSSEEGSDDEAAAEKDDGVDSEGDDKSEDKDKDEKPTSDDDDDEGEDSKEGDKKDKGKEGDKDKKDDDKEKAKFLRKSSHVLGPDEMF